MNRTEKVINILLFTLMGIAYAYFSLFSKQISNHTFAVILITLCLIYFIGFYLIDLDKLPVKIVFLAACIYSIILFTTPIDIDSDTTAYALGARVAFLGKYNPFTTPYSKFTNDTLYENFKNYTWTEYPYTYSPLFLYIGGIFLSIAGDNFIFNIFLFRIFFLITYISGILIFTKVSKNTKAFYLFALNPIVLSEAVKNAHIESLLIPLILLGIYFFTTKRFLSSFLAFISLFLIKIYFIIFLPLVLIQYLKSKNQSLKKTSLAILVGMITIFLFYLPFWKGFSTFESVYGYLIGNSYPLISVNFFSLPITFIGMLFGKNPYLSYVLAGQIMFAAGIVILLFYIFKKFFQKSDAVSFVKSLNFSYLIFLIFFINWFFPHYAVISILLGALIYGFNKEERYFKYIFLITLYSTLFYTLPIK